jgi:hypothetical protein
VEGTGSRPSSVQQVQVAEGCLSAVHLAAWLSLFLLAIPAAHAGTMGAPELVDPDKDVSVERVDQALPDPWAAAIDLQAVWFDDDAEGLHANIKVRDLSALSNTDAGVMTDTFWIAIWTPSYAHPMELENRTGSWELRAEYRPLDTVKVHYWLERPCRDGNDQDGCAGDDRDILNGLHGTMDEATSTIRITAPWRDLGNAASEDAITGLWAAAEMVWPSYPAYSADWDVDQGNTCYRFSTVPLVVAGKDDGPAGASDGRSAFPAEYGPWAGCPASKVPPSPTDPTTSQAQTTASVPANATNAPEVTTTQKSPALPASVLGLGILAVLGFLRGRRDQSK